ncbi:OmpH family outer membrane protein [Phocoenobacter skyensis]|uniref:OmpH family outer membrane protein n=1 Tax=Phocoenobacter skyensis TaxID=97481 RepID=A0A1H7U126_9PAST|nr:OmpH family outer membrane protein [Pasteurella skyensis]MDP8078709.1 OmpH family outer membrane protein [Pasteurella skyensis]MDP8084703.1 OmpH family outer membrane protein [Pasteurella skyensis]MDP8170234.1 OmpH family outer membrane protein [Pasteurella skyensis]MDP8174489.1 OmpH family outer membrane protein [Pasteurella skyensis]MDP8184151.1 OmpH family outer membrane protein [Pasteurella skyensis]
MKNVFKVATLVASLAMASNVANATDKIGFITPEFVIQNHPLFSSSSELAKKVQEERKFLEIEDKRLGEENKALVAEAKELRAEDEKLGKEITAKKAKLEKDAPRLRSKEIKKRQDAIIALADKFQKKLNAFQKKEMAFKQKVASFQKKSQEVQRKLAIEENKVRKEVVDQVNEKLQKIAKSKGYTMVLDTNAIVFVSSKENDLSNEVLKAVGGKVPEVPTKSK